MKIVLVGGGTLGPLSPLLAVKDYLAEHHPGMRFFYIGTSSRAERQIVEKNKIQFHSIPAGKLRRYFSIKNIFDFFQTFFGFFGALFILSKIKPKLIFSAGSYVSVPVAYAAKLLGIKILIHQQDVEPSLSNKLIFPIANLLTVSVPESQKLFSQGGGLIKQTKSRNKIAYTGNPVRAMIKKGDLQKAREYFQLLGELPVLLILGGSSGAEAINKLVREALPQLIKYFEIIHITGTKLKLEEQELNYHPFTFLDAGDISNAFSVAEFVISRAGFSTISELAACKKVSIIIPMPNSHQIANAKWLHARAAAVVVDQKAVTPENIVGFLRKFLFELQLQKNFSENMGSLMPPDATKKVAEEVIKLIHD